MRDRWINAGFEEDELKPYTEPELDITDQKRIGKIKKTPDCVKYCPPPSITVKLDGVFDVEKTSKVLNVSGVNVELHRLIISVLRRL